MREGQRHKRRATGVVTCSGGRRCWRRERRRSGSGSGGDGEVCGGGVVARGGVRGGVGAAVCQTGEGVGEFSGRDWREGVSGSGEIGTSCASGGGSDVLEGTARVAGKSHRPSLNILRASHCMTGMQSWCKCRIMASECQWPSSLMMSASKLPQSEAMAPPACRDQALTSLGASPVLWKQAAAAKRSWLVTSTAQMRCSCEPRKWEASGCCKLTGLPCASKPCQCARTSRMMAFTGQHGGCMLRPCERASPLRWFFCAVKHKLTQVAALILWVRAVVRSNLRRLRWSKTSAGAKAASSVAVPVCSPGRRRKKKATQITSAKAASGTEEVRAP